jgi:hypothetical protein
MKILKTRVYRFLPLVHPLVRIKKYFTAPLIREVSGILYDSETDRGASATFYLTKNEVLFYVTNFKGENYVFGTLEASDTLTVEELSAELLNKSVNGASSAYSASVSTTRTPYSMNWGTYRFLPGILATGSGGANFASGYAKTIHLLGKHYEEEVRNFVALATSICQHTPMTETPTYLSGSHPTVAYVQAYLAFPYIIYSIITLALFRTHILVFVTYAIFTLLLVFSMLLADRILRYKPLKI